MNENTETTVGMTADTMLGTLVGICIDEIKAAPDVWPKLTEDQQDDIIRRVTSQCGDAVRAAVKLIAADGRDTITADLEQITAKEEIKAVCKLGRYDEQRHALLDAVGKPVLIVVASAAQFMGGEIPKAEADQRELDVPVADNCEATAVAA